MCRLSQWRSPIDVAHVYENVGKHRDLLPEQIWRHSGHWAAG